MTDKIFPNFERGMYVKLKSNITESLRMYGHNRCKERYAGQIRKVVSVGDSNRKELIYLERSKEEMKSFRPSRDAWKFWAGDVECIVDFENMKDIKKEEFIFNPEQLVTC